MALPNSLSTTRISGSSAVSGWPTSETALEQSICDILGVSINTSYTVAAIVRDASGRITNTPEIGSAPPAALRLRDTTNNKEFRIASNNGVFTIDENTGSEGSPVWVARLTINAGTSFGGGGTLVAAISNSNTVTNTTTPTAFNKSYTIPANSIAAGDLFRITYEFVNAQAAGNLTFTPRVNSNTVSFVQGWGPGRTTIQLLLQCRTIGASGSFIQQIAFLSPTSGLTFGSVAAQTLDTTASIVLDSAATWSVANVGNTVTLELFTVEKLPAASTV